MLEETLAEHQEHERTGTDRKGKQIRLSEVREEMAATLPKIAVGPFEAKELRQLGTG